MPAPVPKGTSGFYYRRAYVIAVASSVVVGLGLTALYFVATAAHYSAQSSGQKRELDLAYERLDDLEETLFKIHLSSDTLDALTQSNLANITNRTGVSGKSVDEALGADDENIPQNEVTETASFENLVNRVGSLNREVHRVAQHMEGIASVMENRKQVLNAIPSLLPAEGWVSSEFGLRKSPFTGKTVVHQGIDIAAERGTQIYAPANGIVRTAGKLGALGKAVVIYHGYGIVTRFGHNAKLLVRKGQRVKRGQPIASVGNTGRSTGPHVHYEVWVNNNPVNPRNFIVDQPPTSAIAGMNLKDKPIGGEEEESSTTFKPVVEKNSADAVKWWLQSREAIAVVAFAAFILAAIFLVPLFSNGGGLVSGVFNSRR